MEVQGGPQLHYCGEQRPTGSFICGDIVLLEGGYHSANE